MELANSQFEASRVYHDFNGLAELKSKGKDDSPEAIREAAKQFESIFVGMMLKSMRDANAAIIDEPLFDSSQMDMYKDMYDEQLTLHLSDSKSGLGLTDVLVDQLTGIKGRPKQADKNEEPLTITEPKFAQNFDINKLRVLGTSSFGSGVKIAAPLSNNSSAVDKVDTLLFPEQVIPSVAQAENQKLSTSSEINDDHGLDFSSPTSFVQSLWPYAEKAAKFLKLDPKVLIAQAALETGWGKKVMRTVDGLSSKNLFGIKANSSWDGNKTQVTTLELENGTLNKTNAAFRTYNSYADSFNDYSQFIGSKERYQKAREVSSNPEQYTKELQVAGYATDPNYAKKIQGIYNSPILNNAIRTLVDMSDTVSRMNSRVGG